MPSYRHGLKGAKKPGGKSSGKSKSLLEMAQGKAKEFMGGLNQKYGGGARKRRIDEIVEEATSGKPKKRK